nr:hypothetical protein CFP56_44115 [Quercus suber]POF16127.1 hypothetical protein CFP56_15618 [Quercus suber]
MENQARELLLSFSSEPPTGQRRAINLEGEVMEIPKVVLVEIQAKPTHIIGFFKHQHKESMEVHLSVDGGECEGRLATFVRPSLEECEEPMVGISCECANTNGGVKASVGKDTANITNSSVV